MKHPKVSVIMPAYNTEKYIAEAVESILNQTFKDLEFIILDDASTDYTLEIIQRYAKQDNRIILIHNEQNLYIAKNRNKGLDVAKGKYIIWQDADDISYPYRIEKQVQYMENNKEVGICGGYLDSFIEDKITDTRRYPLDDSTLRANIFRQSPVAQPSAIIRKECFNHVGLYNPDYPPAEDIDMSFRIGVYYKFANIPFSVIKYREHPNSATYSKFKKIIKSTLLIRFKNIKNKAYSFGAVDLVFQAFTLVSLLFYPKVAFWLFKNFRKKK